MDYHNNKIWIAVENKSKEFQQLVSPTSLLYFRDSTLYLGQLDRNRLDSMLLSTRDFNPTGEVIFTPNTEASLVFGASDPWKTAFLFLGLFVFCGVLFYFFF